MNQQKKRTALLIDLMPLSTRKIEQLARKEEFQSLVRTHGNIKVVEIIQQKKLPQYDLFIDGNMLNTILEIKAEKKIETLIFYNILKPRQIFGLTDILRAHNIEVWDRVDLILNIFSLHAESAEAKLQIDLARIRHMGPRIFGMGEELSRQGGGIGTSGIGETNTEIMKRHLKEQERRILKKLKKLEQTKTLQRDRRRKQQFHTLSVVGYTNAGKSTLMKALTKKQNVKVEDALFATLDTRIGKLFLPNTRESVLVADTIGFISDLPPKLISAFNSTLAETIHADILLHVVDASDPLREEKIQVVDDILKGLGISEKQQILVFNKLDLCSRIYGKKYLSELYPERNPVFISATEKKNLDTLKKRIETALF